MSPLANVTYSRNQWKHQATQRGDRDRYPRTQIAPISAERDRVTNALTEAQARLRPLEAHLQGRVALPKVDLVWLARPLFFVVRLGLRAVARVLSLLAWAFGIKKAPLGETTLDRAHRSGPRPQGRAPAPGAFSHWPALEARPEPWPGPGQEVAVLAGDAHPHALAPGALSLDQGHCSGVSVADAWTADTIAAVLQRLSAQLGRPAAYLKDGGSELHKAVVFLGEQGLASPCLDDIAHAVAGMLKRLYQAPPALTTFLSACGRVSGTLTHTMLACLAPPTVRTTARFRQVHRLGTWADRGLTLSPAGGAKTGSP